MASRIAKTVAPGIYLMDSGSYWVKVSLGNRARGGKPRSKMFPAGTPRKKMEAWQDDERATLRRLKLVPATGTLDADILKYLDTLKAGVVKEARYQLDAWAKPKGDEQVRDEHGRRLFGAGFGPRHRHTITQLEIQQQIKTWVAADVAASTIRHRLTVLSNLYTELDGESAPNPVKGVKRPKEPAPQPGGRPFEMIDRVLDELWFRTAMNNRGWKTLSRALVLTHTGMRPCQLMWLDPHVDITPHLHDAKPFIQVAAKKGGRPIVKELTTDAVAALLLFVRVEAAGTYSNHAFYKSWKLACEQAGVPFFKPYRLRHSYATELRRAGADLADVGAQLGHTSPKTTLRYAEPSREKVITATRQMEQNRNESRWPAALAPPQPVETKASSK
jgi:integrase